MHIRAPPRFQTEGTDYGQSIFDHYGFGQSNFGQNQLWPIDLDLGVWVSWWSQRVGPKPRNNRPPELWGPERWGSEGWRAKVWRFLFPSTAPIFILSLSGCLLVELWFEAPESEMCPFGLSRCRVKRIWATHPWTHTLVLTQILTSRGRGL